MAERARVELRGVDELERGSRELFERIGEQAPERFEQVADKVADVVRGRVPRHTGALAASVESGRQGGRALVGLGVGVPYAGWIEFGGGRRGGGGGVAFRPYIPQGRHLYPTALSAEPVLVQAGEQTARTEIRRQRWPRP